MGYFFCTYTSGTTYATYSLLQPYIKSAYYGALTIPEDSILYDVEWTSTSTWSSNYLSSFISEINADNYLNYVPSDYESEWTDWIATGSSSEYFPVTKSGGSTDYMYGCLITVTDGYKINVDADDDTYMYVGRATYNTLVSRSIAKGAVVGQYSSGIGAIYIVVDEKTLFFIACSGWSNTTTSYCGCVAFYTSLLDTMFIEDASETKTITLDTSQLTNATVSYSGELSLNSDYTVYVYPDSGYSISACQLTQSDGSYTVYGSVSTYGTITIPYDTIADGDTLYYIASIESTGRSFTVSTTTDNCYLSISEGTITEDTTFYGYCESTYKFESQTGAYLRDSDGNIISSGTYINSSTWLFTVEYDNLSDDETTVYVVTMPTPVAYQLSLRVYSYDGDTGFLPVFVTSTGTSSYPGVLSFSINDVTLTSDMISVVLSNSSLLLDNYFALDSISYFEFTIKATVAFTTDPILGVYLSDTGMLSFEATITESDGYYYYTFNVPSTYMTYSESDSTPRWIIYTTVLQEAEYYSTSNSKTITVTTNSSNAVLSGSSFTTTSSDVTFNVIPLSGYYFADTDTCVATWGDYSVSGYTNSSGYMVITLPYSDLTDGDEITVTWTISEGESDSTSSSTSGAQYMFTVYEPTNDNLSTISSAVFINSDGTYSALNYFIKFMQFYVDIPIAGTTNLKANGLSYNTTAPYVDTYQVTYDLGSITVEEETYSCFDYSPYVDSYIYLPMIGLENINTEQIMGKTCNLQYVVDVLNGNCLAKLYSDDILVDEWSGKVATDLPLIQGVYFDGTLAGMEGGMLGDLVPYIKLERHAVNAGALSEYEGNASNEIKTVGDCSGYVKFNKIWINGSLATQQELETINQLLTTGIIV